MGKKILIVGGVAGGASAAARLRRLDEEAEIIMFERGSYISFANCGLPYYIGGTIQDRSKLLVQTPEAMHQRFRIDVRIDSEVIAVHPEQKSVTVRSKSRGEYEESYDSLILSPGASPLRPSLPGIESPQIMTLRNIPDTDRIKHHIEEKGIRSAAVIGGGFIGVEMAENLREIGLEVTLIEGGPQILAPFDADMAGVLSKELEARGVKLLLSHSVQGFRELGDRTEVRLSGELTLSAELIILAIGVAPDTKFLHGSGIGLGPKGHVLVNDKLQTNLPDIFAVGDAIQITDFVSGTQTAVPLAGPANKQGRIAADNVCGLGTTYKGTQGTSIIKVFGLTGAATGLNEKTLQRLGMPYQVTYVHPNSHAAYYPGAIPMTIKLLFNNEGAVLGAQAVGYDGVDKRIDVIATVIRLKGSVTDLTELELAYAPPYSSAKDPVNMAGYTAENILTDKTSVFVPAELEMRDPASTLLLDVRSPLEHANGHIPGSVNISVDDLRGRLSELDSGKEIWVYCQVGLRGYTASSILRQHGFRVRNLTGGYKTYLMSRYAPEPYHPSADAQLETAAAAVEPASVSASDRKERLPADTITADAVLDACGLCCPGPLIQVKQSMDRLNPGQVLHVTATDPGFYEDIASWAKMSQHQALQINKLPAGKIEAFVRKGDPADQESVGQQSSSPTGTEGTSMVVFSGDLDKAIASFIIANGAAASGKKVTMFFTFWGLNVIRKSEKVQVHKNLIGKMFGKMMPRGSRRLSLSKMNMMGIGAKMIRGVMKSGNIASLEELMQSALDQGVELVACQMSMDVMGIQQEELIEGIKIGGVGYYLGKADQSGINLFI
ncbi:CoA-disulfide reductase [Paenibacillus antibioticophila]|uniref:CoA-disulfide reductase n=1 Tax=Paenibacillus antibioticophila TaxID=1274374 RepID=A0A919XRZ4_9BACL|nr:DsrE/DsrF/DrsH-like family protein [Paenibacillus antibioticophila]GIO37306.1 CoA-disulfide reductase [Paenibacillus antibioticophila]